MTSLRTTTLVSVPRLHLVFHLDLCIIITSPLILLVDKFPVVTSHGEISLVHFILYIDCFPV